MKETVIGMLGAVGAAIAAAFGGWDSSLTTLVILMACDYITGIIVAAFFQNSPKSENGGLSSNAGWKGISRKCVILLFVFIATRLDDVMGTTYLRDAVCIAYIVNEVISLVENATLMGVPVPAQITAAIDVLKNGHETDEED